MLELKTLNESQRNRNILKHILTQGEATRQELVSMSGLTLLTVSKAVSSLLESELLVVDGSVTSGLGRRKSLLKINPEHKYVIGVDIGFSSIKIGVMLFNGQILSKTVLPGYEYPVEQGIPYDEMIDVIRSLIDRFGAERFLGIGASISGMVDFDAGRVLFCPNIAGFNDRPLAEEISEATGLPVRLDTSARCMALGESYFGAGKDAKDQLFVSLGIGSIAAGIILDRRLYRGADGFAGEIGHSRADAAIRDTEHAAHYLCTCGCYDCLELYATESMALNQLTWILNCYPGYSPAKQLMDGGPMTNEILQKSYRAGDSIVTAHIEKIAHAVAQQVSAVINLMDPQVVTLGGGFIWNLPELKDLIEQEIKRTCLVPIRNHIAVRASMLGENAPIQGSALQLIHHYLSGDARP